MSETIRVIAFDLEGAGSPLIVPAEALDGVFEEIKAAMNYGEIWDRYTIEVREMTRAELDALPEWDGS